MSHAANIRHVTRAWNRYEARESMHGGRGWGGGEATIGDQATHGQPHRACF